MRNALIQTVVVTATLLAVPALGANGADVRCGEVKIRAIGKAFTAKLSCHANAVLRGSSAEAPCLTSAQQDLTDAFARAESRGGCPGGVAAENLGIARDSWVAGAVATLAPPGAIAHTRAARFTTVPIAVYSLRPSKPISPQVA